MNRPNLGNRRGFIERLNGMLDRRWFTNDGPLVVELENQLAGYLGVKHCVVTCSGTVALQLVVRALGLTGEVIVPSFTFVSLAHSLLWLGIEPVFCDIEPDTWNLDPTACESLITPRTSAIIGVHLWGRPCNTRTLGQIAERRGLRLLFDAAHAFGCQREESMIGGFGDAEVFSFHATKVFHTFEGGAVTTNKDNLAAQLRLMRNFGFTGYDEVSALGTNAKMPEPSAAMGLANLEVLDSILDENRRCYEAYGKGLDGIPGLKLLRYDENARHNRQYVVLEVDERELGLSRDHWIRVLHSENVLARRYFHPGCHRMEPYVSRSPESDHRLPNTNRAAQQVLVLPAGTGVTLEQVHEVCTILRFSITEADAVRSRLDLAANSQPANRYPVPAEATSTRVPASATNRRDAPKLEIRIPISPTEQDMRMVQYLLKSIQEFGGPIGRAAHCVVSVGADEPPRDLKKEYPWTRHHSIDFHWVDRELFRRRTYDATGSDRLWVESDADVVALVDADLLVAGDFDPVILEAHRGQRMLGFIAHVSPFSFPGQAHIPSDIWWNRIFEEAGLPTPRLEWEHTGWEVDWDTIYPDAGISSKDPNHRHCPPYYNYGFVIGPRAFIEHMGQTFEAELDTVDRIFKTVFGSQIANCLAFARHGIPCGTVPINYNFPLNVPADVIRALNPDPNGEDSAEDIRILHYLASGEVGRKDFVTDQAVEELLGRTDLSPAGTVFQRKLRIVRQRIARRRALPSSTRTES